jgi:hypothetical protein
MGPHRPELHQHRERGGGDGGCPTGAGREEKTPRKAAESEEGDATPDLFLKYLDATIATYV